MVTVASTKTRTAEIRLEDNEAGLIVFIRIEPDVLQMLADARANIDACVSAASSRRCRLLLDIRNAEPLSAEVRHYYSGEKLTQWFSALAILVESSVFGRVMGNLYLRIARPGVPTSLFSDENAALDWLRAVTVD